MTFADVLVIKNGRNQKSVEDPLGPFPIYGSGGIMGYANDYICQANTVIIGRKGNINKPIFVEEPFWNVDTAFGLEAKSDVLLPKYLYYFCCRYDFERLNKAVTIPSLTKADLLKIELDLPSLHAQAAIIDKLVRVEKIISLRRRQIEMLDDLIKARFVEMFGDPIERLDEGKTTVLEQIADRITVGFVGEASNDYVEYGIPYLRTQNVRINHIDLTGLIYVNKEFHNRNRKSIVHPGDVVISRVGVNRGMAAVIPKNLPEANIANCLIIGQSPSIVSQYLAFYLNMSYGKRPQFGASVGSAQGVVNTSVLKKWEVFVPDRSLQEDFVTFSEQIDKSKSVIQKSLDETQLLFDSLMQQYFG